MNDILYNYVKRCFEGAEKFSEGALYVAYQEERMRRSLQKRGRPRFVCSDAEIEHCLSNGLTAKEAAEYLGCSVSTYRKLIGEI